MTRIKRVVSISLGSSKRDKTTRSRLFGEEFEVSRIGVDGDFWQASYQIRRLDGYVDAIGLGGIDRYIYTEKKRYTIRDGDFLANNTHITPIVDGSGLKNTLERRSILYLQANEILDFKSKKVLMVCAVDRFGMAQTLAKFCPRIIYGDLMFSLGIPLPIRNYKTLSRIGDLILPIICRLPFQWLYPTGEKQDTIRPRYEKYFVWADIICGDWHIIRRHLPSPNSQALKNKIIITNTITPEDIVLLIERRLKTLITSTPVFEGRHFATNVIEGIFIAHLGKKPEDMTIEDYNTLLDEMEYKPTIKHLTSASK